MLDLEFTTVKDGKKTSHKVLAHQTNVVLMDTTLVVAGEIFQLNVGEAMQVEKMIRMQSIGHK